MMVITAVFAVPALVGHPVVGGGFCAVASACLIEEIIRQLPGIQQMQVADEQGIVRVASDSETANAGRLDLL